MASSIAFPLNEVQISLLKLTENLREDEVQDLKKLIIAFKARRIALLADKVWQEKGWTEDTMQQFLETHMRTPSKSQNNSREK